MRLLWWELIVFLLILLLAMLPDRKTGRSALYRLAELAADILLRCAAGFLALAAVIEEIPRLIAREWRRERAEL